MGQARESQGIPGRELLNFLLNQAGSPEILSHAASPTALGRGRSDYRRRVDDEGDDLGERRQHAERDDVGEDERPDALEDVAHGNVGPHAVDHEHHQPDRRRQRGDAGQLDQHDAEPDRVVAQRHDHREDHRQRQQEHADALEHRAEDEVQQVDRQQDRRSAAR